jgi:tetratricopeptide (TPR) repeat protein
VCKLASVIGETIPFTLLSRVSELSRPALMSHIATLARRGLLTPSPPAFEYHFAHPLLREAIYGSLAYTQRRAWHRAIGDCLADAAASAGPDAVYHDLEMLAYHYAHSDAPVLSARYQRKAGDKAREQQVWPAAESYYRQALAVEGTEAALQKEKCLAQEALGDLFVAQERYTEADRVYREMENPPVTIRIKTALLSPVLKQVGDALNELGALWETLPPDEEMRSWLAAACGWLEHQKGAIEKAQSWWEQGLKVAQTPAIRQGLKALIEGDVPASYEDLLRNIFTR